MARVRDARTTKGCHTAVVYKHSTDRPTRGAWCHRVVLGRAHLCAVGRACRSVVRPLPACAQSGGPECHLGRCLVPDLFWY
eukprot:6932559-Prymnesium_polylepis.1